VGVIYIGDRSTGKTHLATELANPGNKYVSLNGLDYEYLKSILWSSNGKGPQPTGADRGFQTRSFEVQVSLPVGPRTVNADWLDTPGEIWRTSWQEEKPEQWKEVVDTIRQSEGILLILPPHRDIVKPDLNSEEFPTYGQWCNRFERWTNFFKQECSQARHILICLNKADLIKNVDLDEESSKLAYDPNGSRLNWQQRNAYVVAKYFRPVQHHLKEIKQSIRGSSVQCFITSVYSRPLLELPWLYLGSYLAE